MHNSGFAHLHCHTSIGSMQDSMANVDKLFEKAALMGQCGLAITDHGTMAAVFDARRASVKNGIKYVPGLEAYFVNSLDDNKEKRKHIILLAKNAQGYRNILTINYLGYRNFQYVPILGKVFPKIDWKILEEHSEGIVCLSACSSGVIARKLLEYNDGVLEEELNYSEAAKLALKFKNIFNEDFYLELQPHDLKNYVLDRKTGQPKLDANNKPMVAVDQRKLNEKLRLLSIECNIPMVATCDVHYIDKEDAKVHDMLMAINSKKPLSDKNRHRYEIEEFYLKSYQEVKNYFTDLFDGEIAKEICNNTLEVIGSCDNSDYLDSSEIRFPVFDVSLESDYKEFLNWRKEQEKCDISEDKLYMRFKCIANFKNKYAHLKGEERKRYIDRMKKEVRVLEDKNFSSYMLITADLIKKAKEHDIRVGPGRGCLVGNTQVLTTNGFVALKDISIGSRVYTHTGNPKFVKNKFKYPIDEELVRISTDNSFGDIILTEDHLVYGEKPIISDYDKAQKHIKICNEPQWIEAKDISKGDFIFVPKLIRDPEVVDGIDLGKLKSSNITVDKNYVYETLYNGNNRETRAIKRYIDVNEDFLYFIGRWINSGCTKSNYVRVVFNEDDEQVINKIKIYLESLGFECFLYQEKNTKQMCVHSEILSNIFAELCSLYNNSKYLPVFFRKLPSTMLQALVCGLAGISDLKDGRKVYINTTSERLALEIKEALLYLDVQSSITTNEKYCKPGHKNYEIIFCFNCKNATRFSNGCFVKVLDIGKAKENYVYDIEVEDDCSYVTSNFTVHNSVGGSLVANLLGIHEVDPIKYGLIFERFLNKEKTAFPDIDTDFSSDGRQWVEDYVVNKYGQDKVAHVSNLSTMTPKVVIKDIARSLELGGNKSEAFKIANKITDDISEKTKTFDEALQESETLRKYCAKFPDIERYGKKLVGLEKTYSTHAAGMVISDISLPTYVPLRYDKDGTLSVQYEKNRCESLGLIKMDFLGLKHLKVIDQAIKNARKLGIDCPEPEEIPLDDKNVWDMISKGSTLCVFQMGSDHMRALCRRIKPRNIDDLSLVNALGRPSAKDSREIYIKRRNGKERVNFKYECLHEPLKDTLGICVYEEQLAELARQVAGWNLNKADGLRKLTKLKGKDPKLAKSLEKDFINDATKYSSISRDQAEDIWKTIIEPFAGYGFNRAHGVLYSVNGYHTAYYKYYYPACFMAAALHSEIEKPSPNRDRIKLYKKEAKKMGINILSPDINQSDKYFSVLDEKNIIMGLATIKGVGVKAIDNIINTRKEHDFVSFADFIYRTNSRYVRANVIKPLSKAGCFDNLNISRKAVFDSFDTIRSKARQAMEKVSQDGKNSWDVLVEDDLIVKDIDLKTEWPKKELLSYEAETLDEYISGNMNDVYNGFFKNNGTAIKKINNMADGTPIRVEGVVNSITQGKTKTGRNKGSIYGSCVITDINGDSTTMKIWPNKWKLVKDKVSAGLPIRAVCKTNVYKDMRMLVLEKLEAVMER